MKWNSQEKQKAKQVAKGQSYCRFGGIEFINIPRWQRIKLGVLLIVGIEVGDIHVDIINSGPDVAMKWMEELRKIPGMAEAFRVAASIRSPEFRDDTEE